MFQSKIMPHLLGLKFVVNMPGEIAGYIEKGIQSILPDFVPTIQPEAVSRKGIYCEKISEEQKLFIKLHDALGEDKLKALEKLMKKLNLPTNLPYTEDRIKRIIENVKSSGLTASEIEELAKKYNTDAPLSNTLISLKELLDELQSSNKSTGKPNKNKKKLANKSELFKIENWFVLDKNKKILQPKHDFSDKSLIFTFTNNLAVRFVEGSKIEIKEKEIIFGKEKEKVQIIKLNLKMKVYTVPKNMTGIVVGEEFSAFKMILWRIKAEKFIPLYKNKKIDNATEFVNGKLKLKTSKEVIKYRFVDLQINKIVYQFKNGNNIDYKLEVVPVKIDEAGASYFDGEKHRIFKIGSKVILSFHKTIPKPTTLETIATPPPKTKTQPKLKIGAPNDKHEQEADRTADRIMRMPKDSIQPKLSKGISNYIQRKTWDKEEQYNPYVTKTKKQIQRKCASCQTSKTKEEETLQRTLSGKSGGETINNNFQSSLNSSKGNGRPMDNNTQSFMENRFGNDFSNINIHTGAKSTELNNQIQAKAFTTGNDIYFNQGQYNPSTNAGKHLLAHELTHTIQQGKGNNNYISKKPKENRTPRKGFGVYGVQDPEKQIENTIYFDNGSHVIIPEQDKRIAEFAKLNKNAKKIYLYGYASEEGSKKGNEKQIARRLKATELRVNYHFKKTIKIDPESRLSVSKNNYDYRKFRKVRMSIVPLKKEDNKKNTDTRKCNAVENKDIDKTIKVAQADLKFTIKKLQDFQKDPTKNKDVEALLQLYFRTTDKKNINLIIKRLKDMLTDLGSINGDVRRRCATLEHSTCSTAFAFANNQTLVTFCPKFFESKEKSFKSRVVVHEMAHYIKDYLRDITYAHNRLIRFLTTKQSLKNPDNYALFVNDINKRVITRMKNLLTIPSIDTAIGCGAKKQHVLEVIALSERWNNLAQTGAQFAYSNDYWFSEMSKYHRRYFGKISRFSFAGILDRFKKIKKIFRNIPFKMNCLADKKKKCRYRNRILLQKGVFNICPSFFKLSKRNQVLRLGAEISKLVPEIEKKYRTSYPKLAHKYKTKLWGQKD